MKMMAGAALTILAVVVCHFFLDTRIAIFIKKTAYANVTWARYTASIHDFLFISVCIITTVALLCYLYRTQKGINDGITRLSQLTAVAVPASYLAKTAVKIVFGRVNPRHWLLDPAQYGFHWLHGARYYDGFPSGHMAVFTAVVALFWRFYPLYRIYYLMFLGGMAIALIATNYHFLGDVIAGGYLGLLVEWATARLLLPAGKACQISSCAEYKKDPHL